MNGPQFERLTANIRTDGVLTSLPLVYDVAGDDAGPLVILSGNQRTDAAIEALGAGAEIDVIEIVTRIPEDRRKAIALSHNAITGQDDPNALKLFWEGLSLALKEYSGLTEDSFAAAKLDIASLSLRPPQTEQIVLEFLPEVREVFSAAVGKLLKSKTVHSVYAGRFVDYDQFFEGLMRTKSEKRIHNAAMALHAMAELAIERLAQLEGQGDGADGSTAETERAA